MAAPVIPPTMKQIQVVKVVNNFREATKIVEVPTPRTKIKQIPYDQCVGNCTHGRHIHPPLKRPPFGAGIEAIGEIVATGPSTTRKIGETVAYHSYHCFGEYAVAEERYTKIIPSCEDPVYGAFYVSGATACGAFDKNGFNVAYECVGNELLDICLQNVAQMGKIVSIGTIGVYQKKEHVMGQATSLPMPYAVQPVLPLSLVSPTLISLRPINFASLTSLIHDHFITPDLLCFSH
ncbi:Zinc binding alcohol dehydrogenase domain containing 2 [Plakobranchus ocellatus]|uniref:Zinc binding alcohol dehydrogenase domain containing 2 n=1 Tax=Plakobranchus ocellatus TaxID=259542 RepID=A0AAV4A167_9GAST|nr:Zinc binding alcohol dehydrogenase domain containing 2 [Plakobranchus ocellatus]